MVMFCQISGFHAIESESKFSDTQTPTIHAHRTIAFMHITHAGFEN